MSTAPRGPDFLVNLAADADRLAQFMSSPDVARRLMDAAGLADDLQRAFGSGDLASVHAALRAETGARELFAMPGIKTQKKKKKKGGKKRPPAKPGRKPVRKRR